MKAVSPGTLILGIFAVLFGLVGAYAAKQYMQKPPAAVAQRPKPILVPLAAADLVPGRTLTMGDVMLVHLTEEQIKKKQLPPLFFTNPRQVMGRTLREKVAKGDAFTANCFYPEGMGPSVAERLKPGYRAATIALENSVAEVSLVSPGTIVDVVFRTAADAVKGQPETTINLLESVEVLAIGSETFQGARPANGKTATKPTATVAVTPQQVSALKVVEGKGTMSLVARNPKDTTSAGPSQPQTLSTLLRLPEPKPPFTTEIYRRGSLTTVKFDGGERSTTHESNGFPIAAGSVTANDVPSARRTTVVPVSQTVTQAANASGSTCTSCQKGKSQSN